MPMDDSPPQIGDIGNEKGDIILADGLMAERGIVRVTMAQSHEAQQFGWELVPDTADKEAGTVEVRRG